MNKGFTMVLGLAMGGAAGFLACRRYFEDKYQKIADEEIESVKEVFLKQTKPAKKKADVPATKPSSVEAYTHRINHEGVMASYVTETEDISEGEEPVIKKKEPYVITPESFGELDEYDQVELTYFKDGVLVGDDEEPMTLEEIKESVGMDSLNHFGEYEDDSVFVRNDETKCDYEILKDERVYSLL